MKTKSTLTTAQKKAIDAEYFRASAARVAEDAAAYAAMKAELAAERTCTCDEDTGFGGPCRSCAGA